MHGKGSLFFKNGTNIIGEWENGKNIQIYKINSF